MLSDAKIRAAKSREKPYKLADTGGLYLLIRASGTKTWRFKYRFGGREKTLTIGSYPTISAKEARISRDDAKAALAQGRDPSTLKQQRRLANLTDDTRFEAIAKDWYDQQKFKWSGGHAEDVWGSLERDVFGDLGRYPITEITAPMVLEVVRKIERRPAVETAHRVRQRISGVFVYAIACGIAETDPAAIIKDALQPVRRGRQPAVVDLEDLKTLLNDAEAIPAHPQTRLALRLLALTAIRSGEVRRAHVGEFEGLDGDNPLWCIPAERMKMSRDFWVPLSRQAVDVVQVAASTAGPAGLLFPSQRHAHKPISENAMGYLLNRAGYHGRHVPHGFRASFSTIMNERHPEDSKIIDFMLAHKPKGTVEAAYNRAMYLDRRKELGQLWADLLMEKRGPAKELLLGPRKIFAR